MPFLTWVSTGLTFFILKCKFLETNQKPLWATSHYFESTCKIHFTHVLHSNFKKSQSLVSTIISLSLRTFNKSSTDKEKIRKLTWSFDVHAIVFQNHHESNEIMAFWNLRYHSLDECFRPYRKGLSLRTLRFCPRSSKPIDWFI